MEREGVRKILPLMSALVVLIAWGTAAGAPVLEFGTGVTVDNNVEIPLYLSTEYPVQGFSVAFDWNGSQGLGVDLLPGPAIVGADLLVTRVESDYMAMRVVMDSSNSIFIGPGDGLHIATAVIECLSLGESPIAFVDGVYSVIEGTPPVDNVAVVGGLSIGLGEGLTLINGSFSCEQGGGTVQPTPGALVLGSIGICVVSWLRRHKML